jgi:hypothetical protein
MIRWLLRRAVPSSWGLVTLVGQWCTGAASRCRRLLPSSTLNRQPSIEHSMLGSRPSSTGTVRSVRFEKHKKLSHSPRMVHVLPRVASCIESLFYVNENTRLARTDWLRPKCQTTVGEEYQYCTRPKHRIFFFYDATIRCI